MDVNRNYNANAAYDWNLTELNTGATTPTQRASGANHSAAPHLQGLQPLNRGSREAATNATSNYNMNAAYDWNFMDLNTGATRPAEATRTAARTHDVVHEHTNLMAALNPSTSETHRRAIQTVQWHLDKLGIEWSQLVPPGNTDRRPRALEHVVNTLIDDYGVNHSARAALNQVFNFDLRAKSGTNVPVLQELEHAKLYDALAVSPRYRSYIKHFLVYLEGQNLKWSKLVRPGSTDPCPAALQNEVDTAIQVHEHPRDLRYAINKAFGFKLQA
ncbi:hypothetical protein [Burkholderia latens]|uniref:hypothetical protein n=1 Tax=Burkholderia latens TaxID=488446 RepID=UPI001AE3A893|nr:hypothetical protein [Burkholderia latens]QTO50865.1 hypothetical protein J8I86_25475 [Burkholderia latens]